MRAKVALVGGPLWRSTVAPAIAWAQAVWSAVTRPSHAQFSVKDLCAMWREVKREGLTWAKPRGPISRMH
eukprot:7226246-Pyramimonas_sp.AAC.1